MGLRKGDFCLAIQSGSCFLVLFPKEISICNTVCMPVPSNFSSWWLITTVFETGQKSQKVIMFYKLAQVKISVGQRWFLVPLMGSQETGWEPVTGHGTVITSFWGKLGIFYSPACRETFSLYAHGRALCKGRAAAALGHNLLQISHFLSFHSLFVKEKVFVGEDSSDSRSAARASLGWLRLRLLVRQ